MRPRPSAFNGPGRPTGEAITMTSCPDYGSTVATVIIVEEIILMVVLLANEWRLARSHPRESTAAVPVANVLRYNVAPAPSVPDRNVGSESEITHTIEDETLLATTARANDAIVANIDAINLGAIGIVALPAVFAVFGIDKISDIGSFGVLALLFLGLSILCGLRAFNLGHSVRLRSKSVRDSIDPRRFLAYYAQAGDRAVTDTIRAIIQAADDNATIRASKRALSRWAITLFVIGFILLGTGKLLATTKTSKQEQASGPEIRCVLQGSAQKGTGMILCR